MTADLFLRCRGQQQIAGQVGTVIIVLEGGDQRDQATAGIVASQAVELAVFFDWFEWIKGVRLIWFDSVVVRVEENRRFSGVEVAVSYPNIVKEPMGGDSF